MTASVPWSVNAIGPETWATARDAARRSGLSVGEWLNSAIRESAGETGQRLPARTAHDPLERRLDEIADRLEHFARRGEERPFAASRSGRGEAALAASIDALSDRIETLFRDLHAADRNGPAELRSAIQRLDDRIEDLLARSRLPNAYGAPEIERKLSDIARTIETMSRRLEQENTRYAAFPIPPTVAELDAAVAEIMVRQSALDGVPLPREFPRHGAAMPDLGGIESQIKLLADEMQALRQASVRAETVDSLRREIADLAGKFSNLAPRRSIEAIEHAIQTLTRRFDREGSTASGAATGEVVDALQDIRSALAEVRPAETFASMEKDLHDLSQKLDNLSAKGIDGSTFARIQAQTAEIRDLLSSALPSDALKALVEQIEILVQKFEGAAAPSDTSVSEAVAALDRRIESLSERIEAASRQIPASPPLDGIHARLDELKHALDALGQNAPQGFESAVRNIAEKLDASETRLASLGSLERGLNDLFTQLREARAGTREVAGQAEKSAVRAMTASRTAAADSLHPSGEIESRHASVTSQRPLPTPAATEPALPEGVPADLPLEPGSGTPSMWLAQSAALRVAHSEAALGGIAPKAEEGFTRASDFIAAARRAAKTAAGDAPAMTGKGREPAAQGLVAKSTGMRRALLVALTLFLLLFAAWRYLDDYLPFLMSSISAISTIETPKLFKPGASAPATQNRSSLQTPDFAASEKIPPAGMIGSDDGAMIAGEKGDSETTGSTAANAANGPVQTANVPGLDTLAVQGKELPATIGTPALRAAAIAGDPAAAYQIATNYLEGHGVPVNTADALIWYEHALARGSIPAAFRLGGIHEKAQGARKNTEEARRYYTIAAEGGHIKAMHNLAVLYAEGIDAKPDYRSAARWFRQAADRGLRDSQYNIGVLYARGLGVEQNLAESFRWFSLAAAQGDTESAKKRDDVAGRLDWQTLVAAKLAVQTWSAVPADEAANSIRPKPEWERAEGMPPRKRTIKNPAPARDLSVDKDPWRQLMQ